MERIKVCHIITKLELGGAQRNTLHTVSHLDRGRFVPVLIAGTGGMLDDEARALPDVAVRFAPSLIREACPLRDLLALIELWRILVREKPQVVHTHSSKAGILGRIAARLAGVPVVIHTFHGFGFHDYQSRPVRTLYVLLERLTARLSDRLAVVSNDNVDKALRHGIGRREQYLVIRSGIDINRCTARAAEAAAVRRELGIPEGDRVVTTIGPFKRQKNLTDFIRAAELVLASRPATTFLIIGDGDQRPRLELLAQSLERPGKVLLPGWRRDIADVLAASDIFAMTSLWEGLPRSALEAMCVGLPVVANAVDGIREIVRDGETGFLTTPFKVQETAERILTLLNDPGLARAMGARGRELITGEFDIDRMVRRQEELYLTLITGSPP